MKVNWVRQLNYIHFVFDNCGIAVICRKVKELRLEHFHINCDIIQSCLPRLLCGLKLTLYQQNTHPMMKSDECHCILCIHYIYKQMTRQLTMSRPNLYQIKSFSHTANFKVQALVKTVLKGIFWSNTVQFKFFYKL